MMVSYFKSHQCLIRRIVQKKNLKHDPTVVSMTFKTRMLFRALFHLVLLEHKYPETLQTFEALRGLVVIKCVE